MAAIYMQIVVTRGAKTNKRAGRTMARRNSWRGEPCRFEIERYFGSPVSLRRRSALRSSRIGLYVSWKTKKEQKVATPA